MFRNADVKNWISKVVNITMSGSLETDLKDGNILCTLMNVLKPGSIQKINSKERGGHNFLMLENIESFLDACKKYGVPELALFRPLDLFNEQNMKQVVTCLHALGVAAKKQAYPIVLESVVREEQQKEKEAEKKRMNAANNRKSANLEGPPVLEGEYGSEPEESESGSDSDGPLSPKGPRKKPSIVKPAPAAAAPVKPFQVRTLPSPTEPKEPPKETPKEQPVVRGANTGWVRATKPPTPTTPRERDLESKIKDYDLKIQQKEKEFVLQTQQKERDYELAVQQKQKEYDLELQQKKKKKKPGSGRAHA